MPEQSLRAKWTRGALLMLTQMTLPGFASVISSRGSAFGVMPCASQDGRTTGRSGLDHARANRSVRLAKERGLLMRATSGRSFSVSSASAALQQYLESRLRAKTASPGSTLYRLTWKRRVTPAGRSISALRASARRTSGSACTGWPTPLSNSTNGAGVSGRQGGPNLQTAASYAGWITPAARGLEGHARHGETEAGRAQQDGSAAQAGAIDGSGPTDGFWRDADWIYCRDGKWRPVEPGTCPLAARAASDLGRLRGYGNALNAVQAQAFIEAVIQIKQKEEWCG